MSVRSGQALCEDGSFANNAEKVILMLAKNFGRSNRIIEQLLEEAKLQKSLKTRKIFKSFQTWWKI
jgi:hypothetical protein